MLFNGQITRDVWERLREASRDMISKEKYERAKNRPDLQGYWVEHYIAFSNVPEDKGKVEMGYYSGNDYDAVAEMIGCCSLTAKNWKKRAYEGDIVYPSMYIDTISKILNEPLASDKMIFARLSTDPEYWANQDYSHLELVRKAIDDSEAVRIANAIKAEEAARKAENERKAKAKADALEKIKELSQKIKELADTAETCVSVTVW